METIGCYETSSAQRRLFVVQQFNPHSVAYNLSSVFKILGTLDLQKFEQAVQQLIQRHESMRTIFETDLDNNDISQTVLATVPFSLETLEVEEEQLEEVLKSLAQPFALDQAPLFRLKLIRTSPTVYYLFFDIHHIIADGISIQIMIKEIGCLYNGIPLSPVEVQYVDYVMWQNDLFSGEKMSAQEQYWMQQFADELPVLDLQTDYARPSYSSGRGNYVHFQLNADVVQSARQIAQQEGATLYMVLFSIYSLLLHRYTSQTDIVIGTPIAGRRSAELESVIGMFVNTLALRTRPQGNMTFLELLAQIKQTTLSAYDHQDYPLDMLVERLNIARSSSRHPIFDTMLVVQNMDKYEMEMNDLVFQRYEWESDSSKFDLTLELTEDNDVITGKLEYSTDLFTPDTMNRMAAHFVRLSRLVTTMPGMELHQFDLLDEVEKQLILHQFNDTIINYPLLTIDRIFEEQTELHAERTALFHDGRMYTYRELNDKANRLAHSLRSRGLVQGTNVGIMAERSLEMIVGMLAVIKAGAAYVPIEPDYPTQRILNMLEDSSMEWLLVQGEPEQPLPGSLKILDLLDESLYSTNTANLGLVREPDQTAIIIFTSGTTGRPKGIMIKHLGISRLVKQTDYVELSENTRLLQTCALGFDVFTFETWAPLLNGGCLYLTDKNTFLDPARLKPFLLHHSINIMTPTTALFNHLLNEDPEIFNNLETIIVGGEVMSPSHVQILLQHHPHVRLKNGYGPAESTTYTTTYDVTNQEKKSIPIGKPITGTTCYVLDAFNQPVPIGVAGELFIGGDGLTAGYVNRQGLTDEKFLTVPWLNQERLYRSGDLVKWRADGNLIYLGRRDHQIKIRGYRIELEEIKRQILSLPQIQEAVVIPIKQEGKETQICAYYTATTLLNESDLRTQLQQLLPEFMVPQLYVQLKQMPMSANNKINTKELPPPERVTTASDSDFISHEWPLDELERIISDIWSEILELKMISVTDNFFLLGGHSLKAVLIVARLRKELGVDVGMDEIFAQPTIRGLANQLRFRQKEDLPVPQIVEQREFYPASYQQTRLYVLEKMRRFADTSNNITDVKWITGALNKNRLRKIVQQLMERHESLRLSHQRAGEQIVFKVHDQVEVPLEWISGTEEQLPERIRQFVRPFDLTQAPLFRVGVVTISSERHVLIFDIHHSISDGFSLGLLTEEVMALFRGESLPPLEFQYKDYAVWQQSFRQSDAWHKQERYWLDIMKGSLPVLHLPTDYPRPDEQNYEGALFQFQVSIEMTFQLKRLADDTHTTLYMLLLTVYFTLLQHYSGDEDIMVGTPVAGRNQVEFQQLLGMFVNTIVLRSQPTASKTVRELLKEVRTHTIEAFSNQDYPLELLIEKLDVRPLANRNPLFQTMFALQNMDIHPLQVDGLVITPYAYERKSSIADILLIAQEDGDALGFTFEYSTRLFRQDTVEQMAKYYVALLESLLSDGLDQTIASMNRYSDQCKNAENEDMHSLLTDTFSF